MRSSQAKRGFFRREVAPATSGSVVNGSQKSSISELASFAPKKPGGAMPIIVNGWPLKWYVAPTADGSDPYFPCQAWKLSTATGGAPSRSSASVKKRPRQAEMPNVSKKLPETYSPLAIATGTDKRARRTLKWALPSPIWNAASRSNAGVPARKSLNASHEKRFQSFDGRSLPFPCEYPSE